MGEFEYLFMCLHFILSMHFMFISFALCFVLFCKCFLYITQICSLFYCSKYFLPFCNLCFDLVYGALYFEQIITLKTRLYFLALILVHSKIKRKVQRFPIYSMPLPLYSRPYYQYCPWE